MFLDPRATTERILARIDEAAEHGVELLAFPETFLPGYPVWLSVTGGAAFDDPEQKAAYAQYVAAAVRVDGPELAQISAAARARAVSLVLGVVERAPGPMSASVYATAISLDARRGIVGAHRKLVPTWEERLVWSPGVGHGLRVHELSGAA